MDPWTHRGDCRAIVLNTTLPPGVTLTPNGASWLLRYQISSFDYGERLASRIDVTVPIAPRSYDDALELALVILRDYKPPVEAELFVISKAL
jgi:hypothetical protein